jgi:aspartate/methionine/tyrosine aminotransferase
MTRLPEFSNRTDWSTEESDLARAHRERLELGLPIIDLTASNPTRCGFEYSASLLAPLAQPEAFDYDPNPSGLLKARLAVVAYYADHGANVPVENVLLTTSTSDPGEAILVPQPGYPLFDFLAKAESIEVGTTPLIYDHGWQLDLESLRRKLRAQPENRKIRALVLVHPNNPTGHFTSVSDSRELAAICREYGLALILDEVFLDYPHSSPAKLPDQSTFATRDLDIPLFVVSGISKICGLPQMKAAWLVALGPAAEKALARLEILADTYLSMNAPVQHALPVWLQQRTDIQAQIQHRVQTNLAALDLALEGHPLANRLIVQAGWYAILRIPANQPDEITAMDLLKLGVWVHPGYFFGFPSSGWLVVSLLTQIQEFKVGITRVLQYVVRN